LGGLDRSPLRGGPFLQGAAEYVDGKVRPRQPKEEQESHGRIAGRCLDSRKSARDSVSPSCSWLSGFLKNHERKPKCSTFTALSWIGAGASSFSKPAR
jgi:hypothetical protein